tara:strand:- start:1037 stop:2422 length:1386 start_codon:yes stop_codon:yes gene_type:complete
MERVLPKTLDYTDVLPLAVESRARRRTFFPINGQSFSSDGANIIRIDLSADALLDTQHSYLRFRFTAKTQSCGIDQAGGHAFIRRLRVEQSGTILEDINSYNRLMGAIVLPCQSSNEHNSERAITEGVMAMGKGRGAGVNGANYQDQATGEPASQILGGLQNKDDQVAADGTFTFSIPLNSGLLNNDKLLPLMLMSAPLTIEIELAPSVQPVCWNTGAGTYNIDNVRYIANLIEVGQDVAQQLRMVQEVSGGVLTLAGQTYRHFTGTLSTGSSGDQIINVPARVKSMKSMFFAGQGENSDAYNTYDVAQGNNLKLQEYQLKIGSVVYPPTPVRCDFTGGLNANIWDRRGEPLMELAKSWGSVGSTKGMGQLNSMNLYKFGAGTRPVSAADTTGEIRYAPFGLDLEAFQRVAIESGVNTADRSLPISLILNVQSAIQQNIDCYVLADALFYLNADGSMSVSV